MFTDFQQLAPFRTLVPVVMSEVAGLTGQHLIERGACQWRLDHLADYAAARPWLEAAADLVADATLASAAKAVLPLLDAPDGR